MAPFYAPTIEQIIKNNSIGMLTFPEEYWKNVSKEAKELVELMTNKDPSKRITADQCLQHVWLAKGGFKNTLHSAVINMKKYCTPNDDRFDVGKIKPDFGLLTSTPLLNKAYLTDGGISPPIAIVLL